jgi:PAS domain S-box-containing protein
MNGPDERSLQQENQQLHEALRDIEKRLRLAEQLAGIGTFDWNIQNGTNAWTPELEAMYGLPPGGFPRTQTAWENLVHPDDRSRTIQRVKESFEVATPVDGEWRVIWPDGSVRWLVGRWQVFKNPAGEPERMTGVNIDVTDRKQAEAALYESTIQYKEVFDNISICVFVIDVTPDGHFKIAAFNPAEEELVGLSNAEVSGRFVEDLFPENLANELIANYRNCVETGRTMKFDHELNLPQRGRCYFHSNLIPLRNAAGVITRIIGACVETTDFKRTQEEALAKQNLETLGVLAGGIAHDFNNVLGGIHAQAELIEADLALDSVALEEIRRIKVAATRGAEIVRELMVYAGQEQSYFEEVIDLSRLIKEMMGLLRLSISKHSTLRSDLALDLPTVLGNAAQLRQVVMNLVINASEAIGSKDGVITVTTAHVIAGRERVLDGLSGLPEADCVRLEVSDTGSGIADQAKAKIFDPFFTTKLVGRGMGLAVVQRIVQNHGGAIRLSSSLGQGTTFRVFLPIALNMAAEIQSSRPAADMEQTNARKGVILVVDDEELLRQAVSKLLRRLGFVVVEASDGSEAMRLIRANKDGLEAVLLDVTLPGISSRDILEEAHKIRPTMKVIVTSAYSKETVDAAFVGLRIHDFIRKPFCLADLVRSLTDPMTFTGAGPA